MSNKRTTGTKKVITEAKTYSLYLEDALYKELRKASMRGKFAHKFSRVPDGDTTFTTTNPRKLAQDLENIIDFGATSAFDVLDISPHGNPDHYATEGILKGIDTGIDTGKEAAEWIAKQMGWKGAKVGGKKYKPGKIQVPGDLKSAPVLNVKSAKPVVHPDTIPGDMPVSALPRQHPFKSAKPDVGPPRITPSSPFKKGPGKIQAFSKPAELVPGTVRRAASKRTDVPAGELASDALNLGTAAAGGYALLKKDSGDARGAVGTSPRPRPRPRTESITEGVLDNMDDDGFVAKRQLYDTAKDAIELHKTIHDSDNLEPWIMAKIEKAQELLSSVTEFLSYSTSIAPVSNELPVVELEEDTYEDAEGEITADDVMRYLQMRKVISTQMAFDPSPELQYILQAVADFYTPMDELGSSDISIIIRHVVDDMLQAGITPDGDKWRNYINESSTKIKKDARRIYEKMTLDLRK